MALSTDPAKRDSQMIRLKASKAGMTEDQYKDWLHCLFGVRSATELGERQRRAAHAHLGKLLDARNGREDTGTWREPQIRKLDALWGLLPPGPPPNGSPASWQAAPLPFAWATPPTVATPAPAPTIPRPSPTRRRSS